MRILHVTAGIQETCGVSCFVMETARAQMALGHSVCVVTTMTCGYPIGDVDVRLLDEPTLVDFQPDVVHLHSIWNLYVHKMAVWCRQRGIPYIVSPHGALTSWALKYKWWKKLPALLLYQYNDLRKASGFHVTAENEAGDLRRLALKQSIAVAPLGVELLPDEKSTTGRRDILFLGRIHPVKNLIGVLKAWASLKETAFSGWRLIIAGPDDVGHQAELKSFAAESGLAVRDFSHELEFGKKQILGGEEVPLSVYQNKLADCTAEIVFTGPVYAETKNWLYQQARFFILPSFSENFGNVVLEAMAAGTPCITTVGTPWNVLAEHKCGWRCEPTAEAIGETLQQAISLNEQEYLAISGMCRAFVKEHYSWRTTAEKLLELYRNC